MRWSIFAIVTYIVLSADLGLRTLVTVGSVRPDMMLVLAVFIGFSAPGRTAAWAGLLLGSLVDMTGALPIAGREADVVVVGPSALGYLVAVVATVRMRTMLYRKSPTAVAVLVMVCGIAGQLVTVGILTARGLPWLIDERIPGWDVADQMTGRFLGLVYSAVIAAPIGWLLLKTRHWWGFGYLPGTGRS